MAPTRSFLHIRVARADDTVDERTPQTGPALLEHTHRCIDALLVLDAQRLPPRSELIGELDTPHPSTIPQNAYAFKRIEAGPPQPAFVGAVVSAWRLTASLTIALVGVCGGCLMS